MTRRGRMRRTRSCAGRSCIPVTSVDWRRSRTLVCWPAWQRPRGRPAADPRDAQIARLREEKAQLEQKLAKSRFVVDMPSKLPVDDPQERGHRARVEFVTDAAIALLAPRIGTRVACAASGVPHATWYRRHRISPLPRRPVPVTERVQPRRWARPSGRRSWTCRTPGGSLT
jgi:hypothetical protein